MADVLTFGSLTIYILFQVSIIDDLKIKLSVGYSLSLCKFISEKNVFSLTRLYLPLSTNGARICTENFPYKSIDQM